MVKAPNYGEYSLIELYQALNHIRSELYPHIFDALERELRNRHSSSRYELEDCYFLLDKDKYPEYSAKLAAQIEALGGFIAVQPEEITEKNRYKTFWRRFWALFLDGFVVGIPLWALAYLLHRAGLFGPPAEAYLDQFTQIVGLAYYIAMHTMYGQTVGKMATGVKILDKSEETGISFAQALVRDIVPVFFAGVSLAYFLIFGDSPDYSEITGFSELMLYATGIAATVWALGELVTMLFNPKRRALHDFIARTVVVRVP